jgi:hypothetical protein
MASRRSAPQPPSRPSRRPEVAETERGRASPQATAGRRAGAQTRRAPNATAGRCIEETGPGALLPNEVLPNARGGCQAPLKRPRDSSGREATGGRLAPLPWAPIATHYRGAPFRAPQGPRITCPLSTQTRATAGVRSLRMCRRRSRLPWAHSQGGHPRESRIGEARHSHRAGRRDARRWPTALEHENRDTPPQGGEPERRRDKSQTRRQAGEPEKRAQGQWQRQDQRQQTARAPPRPRTPDTAIGHGAGHGPKRL